jgi:DNA adenine methylase
MATKPKKQRSEQNPQHPLWLYDPRTGDISDVGAALARAESAMELLHNSINAALSGASQRQTPRSPVRWLGGKDEGARHIAPFLPKHKLYIEVFGGGLRLLFQKPRSKIEIVNDLDDGLITWWRVLQDPDKAFRLRRRLKYAEYSRVLYMKCRATWQDYTDDVERAFRWFVVARMSFSANWGGSWGFGRAQNPATTWHNIKGTLEAARLRLSRVTIEKADWRDILSRFDCPDALFYLDPPYVPSTRRSGEYKYEMTVEDHEDLVARLLRIEGGAILSGYPNDTYKPLEEAGWHRYDRPTTCRAAGRTRRSGLAEPGAVKAKQPRTECIWVSPQIADYVAERAGSAGWTVGYVPD